MFRYIPLRVRLDKEVEVAEVLVRRNGCIGAHDFFRFAIYVKRSCNGHVLANWEAEDL